jgi:uncharacterized lipoprotein YddW (UPF0748 family)
MVRGIQWVIILLTGALCTLMGITLNAQNNPKREMRGVWVATVENIDWPSTPFLSVTRQKEELTAIFNLVKEYNLNTVIFQIRPAADAFYCSSYEPWSAWLTGTQGKAPVPFYDPLEFAIAKCRERGLDIHVWINPYRAVRDTASNSVSPDHITKIHPEWFLTYGSTVYFDPGLPETRNYVIKITCDIVRRYDIDAVHMDDYFYPYRIAGVNFPDDSSFSMHHGKYSEQQKDDWRRNNVDRIIQQLHDSIKAIKPYVQFGISPFGVWRNNDRDTLGSATRAGQTNYDDLFADILKWQREGWIDYVAPQLYWQIGMKIADYAILAKWWNQNTYGCPLYIGQAVYRINPKSEVMAWRTSEEIIRQIALNRSLANINGNIFFSAKYLSVNPQRLKENLKKNLYSTNALPPVNPGIKPILPGIPQNAAYRVRHDSLNFTWQEGGNTKNYILYKFRKDQNADTSNPDHITGITNHPPFSIKSNRRTKTRRYLYVVTAQSYTNLECEPVIFTKAKKYR